MNDAELNSKYYMPCFGRSMKIVKGEICNFWDDKGNKYLDLVAGIAVCSTGHCHPKVVEAVCKQAHESIHCSNIYHIPGQAELTEKISKASVMGKVFFSNSGEEANEAALKLAKRATGRTNFVSFNHNFHRRIIVSLAVTHKPAIREPSKPLGIHCELPEYGNLEALKAAVNKDTAVVIFEPIQGENGAIIPNDDFLPPESVISATMPEPA